MQGIRISNRFHRIINDIKYLLISKEVIYFGGSLFHEKIKFIDLRRIILMRKKFLDKTCTIGISVGQIEDAISHRDNKFFLDNINKVYVRNVRSTKFIESKKYSFDLAILIREYFPQLKDIRSKKYNRN